MKVCSACLMPSTRPRITFDGDICNACKSASTIASVDIDYDQRRQEFNLLSQRIIDETNSSQPYNCIVPWSGGKDSSAVALKLRSHGLKPLLVHFNPLVPTPVGCHNRQAMLDAGFDCIEIKPSRQTSRHLSKRFLIERGNPKLHWDAGINASLFKSALSLNIKFIFYAEHGETHYGGRILSQDSERVRDYEEVIENQIGDDPSNWVNGTSVTKDALYPYIMPSPSELAESGIEAHYYGYYFPWNVVENYRYVKDCIDFKEHPDGRTPGTSTNYDSLDDYMDDLYYYFQFIKFGFGRAIRDLSRQIQKGETTRESALALARKYDGEYPEKSIPKILDYLSITSDELHEIIDSHRSKLIWHKEANEWINKVHQLIF